MQIPDPAEVTKGSAPTRDVVVVGSSMGGIDALVSLVGQLHESLPASVFVVQHRSAASPDLLDQILSNRGPLQAVSAESGMPVERGKIYVAPPNRHLLLTDSGIRTVFGPRENHSRPSIDVLFRSAAVFYRTRVIGIVLTGMLGDGAAGLLAVKRCGGVAVVQDPEDAAYPEMPRMALAAVEADHQVALSELGSLLGSLTSEPASEPPPVPKELLLEVRLTERAMENVDFHDVEGSSSPFSCPECGGVLHEIRDDRLRRYRCHVGHAFTNQSILTDQDHAIEKALWVASRTLKERIRILEAMARDNAERGHHETALDERIRQSREHEDQILSLLTRTS